MNYLILIPRTLWKTWFVLNFVLGLIILYPLFFIFLSNKNWYPWAFKLKRFWAHWILFGSGLFYTVKRSIEISAIPQPCVICANHTSYLDIVLSYCVLTNYYVFIGKAEIKKAPLFNIFFKDMNILVNRKSKMDSHRAFLRAACDIDEGKSVFIFPEATISKDGKVLPYKNGAFKLAIDKQIPILPLSFIDNWKKLQNGGFFKAKGTPGILKAIIHKPIETKGLSEADLLPLKQKVKEVIESYKQT